MTTFVCINGISKNNNLKTYTMKNLIFICFPPIEKSDSFAGMMLCPDMESAKELQKECAGRILISTVYFN